MARPTHLAMLETIGIAEKRVFHACDDFLCERARTSAPQWEELSRG